MAKLYQFNGHVSESSFVLTAPQIEEVDVPVPRSVFHSPNPVFPQETIKAWLLCLWPHGDLDRFIQLSIVTFAGEEHSLSKSNLRISSCIYTPIIQLECVFVSRLRKFSFKEANSRTS